MQWIPTALQVFMKTARAIHEKPRGSLLKACGFEVADEALSTRDVLRYDLSGCYPDIIIGVVSQIRRRPWPR